MKNSKPKLKKLHFNTQNEVTAIILAAGKGTRMANSIPKVLHPICGIPMIQYSIESCIQAGIKDIRVVAGHGLLQLKEFLKDFKVQIFPQAQQLGTANAVQSAQIETALSNILILNGDHPLIESSDILDFIDQFKGNQNPTAPSPLGVLTAKLRNPKDFGRIIRKNGKIIAIVEKNEATPQILKINEINTGIYIASKNFLLSYLPNIQNMNKKGEYYLTDLVGLGVADQQDILTILGRSQVSFGVNTQRELSIAHRWKSYLNCLKWMDRGAIILDPHSTYIENDVIIESGSIINPFVILKGKTHIQSHAMIESHSVIENSIIESEVQISAFCHFKDSHIKKACTVGPFARLRPETILKENSHVGNFVEMKKVTFGPNAKAGHLSYLGDADIGEDTNIGCGTITCNYAVDKKKYRTHIGKRVFVGSDTQFVAPITVGDDAVIGSGSTITKDVPSQALAVSRSKQFIKPHYKKQSSNE